jgi:DNA replication initiation complex subunit (GINS family)
VEHTVITYETIYEFLRNEKNKEELQPLSESFFDNVANYLAEKNQILADTQNKTDIFSRKESQKIGLQIQNVKNILSDIYTRREKKLIEMAINLVRTKSRIVDTSSIHPLEKPLFDSVMRVLEESRQTLLTKLLTPATSVRAPPATKTHEPDDIPALGKNIQFLSEVDKFIDAELNEFGPFSTGDKAVIPDEIASILVTEGKAKNI